MEQNLRRGRFSGRDALIPFVTLLPLLAVLISLPAHLHHKDEFHVLQEDIRKFLCKEVIKPVFDKSVGLYSGILLFPRPHGHFQFQLVHLSDYLFNGITQFGPGGHPEWQLHDLCQYTECVLLCPDPPLVKEVSKLCLGREGLLVEALFFGLSMVPQVSIRTGHFETSVNSSCAASDPVNCLLGDQNNLSLSLFF